MVIMVQKLDETNELSYCTRKIGKFISRFHSNSYRSIRDNG